MTKSLPVVFVLMALTFFAVSARAAEPPEPPDRVASARVLTLAEALRAARAHQPALQLALGNLLNAEGQADQARAPLLPQLNGTASYNRATNNFALQGGGSTAPTGGTTAPPPPPASFATIPFWKFSLNASQLVYDFGESINRWKAAKVSAESQAESVHVTESQVTYNVRSAFFAARAAKDMVGVAQETLANQERHLDQVTTLVKVGNRPQIDLTQARADRATAQLQLINAENTYAVAKATLNQAMGVERSIDYDPSDEAQPPVDGEDQAVDALVDEAKKMRPEMASLRLAQQSQELGVRSARDMYWPNLGLSGSISEQGHELDQMVWNLSGFVTLSVPILQGGAINAQIREAEGQLVSAKAQLDTQRQQVRLDVEQARLGVRAAKGAMAAAEDALANTRDRLRLAEGRYTSGIGNIIELGDAQLALTAAAAQAVQARYQLSTARAQLLKALGRP
jgi:outer membrane protein